MPLPGQVLGEIVQASADPAAGGEVVFTADQDMIVYSLYFTFVASVAVGNRLPALVADDGTNIFFKSSWTQNHTASQTRDYCAYAGAPRDASGIGPNSIPLPSGGLRLRKGDRLRTSTVALDAGDDYGVMRLQVEHL